MDRTDGHASQAAPLTLAYVTDRGLFKPSVFSAFSALKHAKTPVRLLFVGLDLTDAMKRALVSLAARFPHHVVEPFALPQDWLREARSPKNFITPTALGRMFLPRITGGRVLYIDGDTMVPGDVSTAGAIDLKGRPIAGVRDFTVQRWRALGAQDKLARQAALFGGTVSLENYINSGVLLMDCDAIRAEPALQAAMEDMKAAQGYPTVDQDRINLVFNGRITPLDPAWNCSWGRLARQRRDMAGLSVEGATATPRILHFHGPNKPWQRLRLSTLRKGGFHILRYRRLMGECERAIPELGAL
ncbi:glycosyltransferase family 8 protein [Rhizobium sp. YIM 134829]|uniref:glycosyltransferase family 8 protein n=1 Tax=Rhizobium sp. YIM 134829 TaxID=3390453 RepID=UPI00397CA070